MDIVLNGHYTELKPMHCTFILCSYFRDALVYLSIPYENINGISFLSMDAVLASSILPVSVIHVQ